MHYYMWCIFTSYQTLEFGLKCDVRLSWLLERFSFKSRWIIRRVSKHRPWCRYYVIARSSLCKKLCQIQKFETWDLSRMITSCRKESGQTNRQVYIISTLLRSLNMADARNEAKLMFLGEGNKTTNLKQFLSSFAISTQIRPFVSGMRQL